MTLEDLGYNSFFEAQRQRLQLDNFVMARIIAEHRGAYTVLSPHGEYCAKVTGKRMFTAVSRDEYPAVGDWVAITQADDTNAVIHATLPRKTAIKRGHGSKHKIGGQSRVQIIAANIDEAFVVESVDRDYNLNRIERYFAVARHGGITPAIILNKTDLITPQEVQEKTEELTQRFPDTTVITTSTESNDGLDALRAHIQAGKTYCFLGSSGVGKSSLINKLLGQDVIRTRDISAHTGRGTHTTSGRHMYILANGGIVIDNPGMREVGVADAREGISSVFDHITALARTCKFADCTHTGEPGCEVVRAVKSGVLSEAHYANYLNLNKEAEYYEMNDVERREKDRSFGKFIKRAKKDLKNIGHKDR